LPAAPSPASARPSSNQGGKNALVFLLLALVLLALRETAKALFPP